MRILSLLGKLLLYLLGILLLYVVLAVVLSLIPTRPDPVAGAADREIHISSNGVHTDFILPTEFVPPALLDQFGYLADYPYLAFGWGDKGFYLDTPTWAELKVSTAVRAMLLPSPTAMHVTGYNHIGAEWASLRLTGTQLDILNNHIAESFRLSDTGTIRHIDAGGYGPNDEFYEAVGSYNALYTCNNWVNAGLKKMQVRTALWAPSEWGIMRWLPH
ncbi:TIGR02117 family protein [Lewinella sp. JB7]|uniref:TIGR02117 family protein n=1 Tax=Lewinella sp. JB7 TaxID=2962887 RepID=UPI0020CA0830|nr:TIGR02117 family protein [Lewinella sp. JB7]MCP9235626.1 TIGR02117 family protein [Lewinella sp. JB7]